MTDWPYEPDVVQALLPTSLQVDVIDGAAWVGLIPFHMTVRPPSLPAVPWVSRFLETNVRTDVRDHPGRSGIWFFSLDASRLGAVLVARSTYHLPYFWSRMRMQRRGDVIKYDCARRWPRAGPISSIRVEIGQPYPDEALTAFDH